jgi:hypothetical protein
MHATKNKMPFPKEEQIICMFYEVLKKLERRPEAALPPRRAICARVVCVCCNGFIDEIWWFSFLLN